MPKKKKRIKIKTFTEEISFAFDPKTGKKFFMRKDNEMPDIIKILQDEKLSLLKRDDVLKVLKDEKISDDGVSAIEGVLKILLVNKDSLPKGILTKIAKSVPEYSTFADPCNVVNEDEIRKKVRAELVEEFKKDSGDFEALKAQMIKLEQDLKSSNEELKSAKVEIAKAQDEREFIKIRQDLIDSGAVGDIESTAHMIQAVGKLDEDLSKKLLKQQKDLAMVAQSLGVDSNLGHSGMGEKIDPHYEQLEKLVQDKLAATPGLKTPDAWKLVRQENKDLFKRYLESRR